MDEQAFIRELKFGRETSITARTSDAGLFESIVLFARVSSHHTTILNYTCLLWTYITYKHNRLCYVMLCM